MANGLTLYPARPYAPGVPGPQDDEGSFAAGRQSLLDALQSLEQRAHERAERMVRDAERTARQLSLDSEQRAYQLISEAEERARQTLADAEQRGKQMTVEAAQRLADLEQQLTEVRDNLEFARAQIEEQVVSVSGQVELARATLNTVRQQLTTGGAGASSSRRRGTVPCRGPSFRACRQTGQRRPSRRHRRPEPERPARRRRRAQKTPPRRAYAVEPVEELAEPSPTAEETPDRRTAAKACLTPGVVRQALSHGQSVEWFRARVSGGRRGKGHAS